MKLTLCLVFLTQLIIPTQTFAAVFDKGDKRVTVSGQCVLETTPDRGSIQFTADALNSDPKVAIQKATDLYEKMREEFKRSKVKNLELSTSEYSVNERREWENNKSVSKGFAARMGLKATTTDIAGLGDLIAIAARVGVKESSGLSTYLSEQKSLDEKKKCLETAARNAREKAESLAKSLGAKVGPVLLINERGGSVSGGEPPRPFLERGAMMKSMAADAGPTVEGQKITINQDVEITFALE